MERGKLRRTTALILSAALLLGLSEVGLRLGLGLGRPLLMMSHPTIEYLARPNQEVRRFGRRAFYNQYSMRSPSLLARKTDPAEFRILFLGDSVVNGGSILDQEELATNAAALELQRAWKRPVLGMNVSAGSWGPENQLAYVREYGLFDCDAAVIVWSVHDLDDVPTFAQLSPLTHPTQSSGSALSELIFRYGFPLVVSALESPRPEVASKVPAAKRGAVNKMRELLDLLRARNVPTLVLLHLTRQELSSPPTDDISFIAQLAVDKGSAFIDLGQDFRQSIAGGGDPYRKNDPIHTSALGQQLIAARVVEWLR